MIAMGSGAAARGVPVILPTSQANADAYTYVVNMAGASAGASETGAGGGLTGADLVLPAFGGPAAVSSSYRQINGGQGFSCTAALLAALLAGKEWTVSMLLKDITYSGSGGNYLNFLYGASILDFFIDSSGHFAPQTGGYLAGGTVNLAALATVTPAATMLWASLWRKGNNVHFGFSANGSTTESPTGWDDFPTLQRTIAINAGNYATEAWATTRNIIGNNTSNATFKVATLIVSKKGLQAPPF
jgi:hypothetical protein